MTLNRSHATPNGNAPRAALAALAVLAAVAALAGCKSDSPQSAATSPADYERALAGAPPPLKRLYAQGNRLVKGGTKAFEARLASLRGYPVVVNKWASWCGPCRAEFPFFQRQAKKRGARIAFIGVNAEDGEGPAREFLRDFPVPYPSHFDPDSDIAKLIGGARSFPTTSFYDARGDLVYTKQGGYAAERVLADDIEQYALGQPR